TLFPYTTLFRSYISRKRCAGKSVVLSYDRKSLVLFVRTISDPRVGDDPDSRATGTRSGHQGVLRSAHAGARTGVPRHGDGARVLRRWRPYLCGSPSSGACADA